MSDFPLGDYAFLRFKKEFDRIFYRDEMFIPCFVQILEHSDKRSGFTRTCRTSHQVQSFFGRKDILFDAVSYIREDKFIKFFGHSIDLSHNHSDFSCLEESIHPIGDSVFRKISKISLFVSEKFIESLWIALEKLS